MPESGLNRRQFVAAATAWTAAGAISPYAHAMLGKENDDAARVDAVAAWLKEDVEAADAAGLHDAAETERAEMAGVKAVLSGAAAVQYAGLFPPIVTMKGNPWLDATLLQVNKIVKEGKRYPRGADAEHKDLGIQYTYPYIRLGTEGVLLAHAFGDRQSPFFGEPSLIAPMLRRFRASYEILTPASKHLADFGASPHISEMHCLFKTAFPGLLPPSVQRSFEEALRRNAEAILDGQIEQGASPALPKTTREQIFLHPVRGNCYPNSDSHYMVALLFSGMALKDERMLKAASSAVDLMGTAIYPDGGTAYIGFQNECFTYHGIMINDLVRYWQVTGDSRAIGFARASRWYYPLAMTKQGVAEYSSAPSWKHYWNGIKGTETAAIISSFTECGYNALVAENDRASASWLAATTWKPVAKAAWWDGAITYDASLQGLRGRYGSYSFCATSRNTLSAKRGKATYVGSLLVDSSRNDHLLAAFDSAWGEVALRPQPELKNGAKVLGDRFHGVAACLARNETTAYTVTPHFGAVSAVCQLAEYGRPPVQVAGRQMWLLTPERIVGRIEVECLQDVVAYGLGIGIKMICGRATGGVKQEWKAKGDLYEYGDYTLRLWPAGGEGDLMKSPNRTASYSGTFGEDSEKAGILVLHDASASTGETAAVKYKQGARHFALVEIYPTAKGGAQSVVCSRTDDGLVRLELREKSQRLVTLHNVGEQEREWLRPAEWGGAMLHPQGEVCRLEFLPPVDGPKAAPVTERVTLAPLGHAVLRLA